MRRGRRRRFGPAGVGGDPLAGPLPRAPDAHDPGGQRRRDREGQPHQRGAARGGQADVAVLRQGRRRRARRAGRPRGRRDPGRGQGDRRRGPSRPGWARRSPVGSRGWSSVSCSTSPPRARSARSSSARRRSGSVLTPLSLLLIGTYVLAQSCEPRAAFGAVLAIFPFTSPIVMPARLALGDASPRRDRGLAGRRARRPWCSSCASGRPSTGGASSTPAGGCASARCCGPADPRA